MKLPIVEIFESLQGEGPNTGKLSLFIRTFGCNLHCGWCDTPYAILPKSEFTRLTVDEIIFLIKNSSAENIVFTGGEPLLFQKEIGAIIDGVLTEGNPYCFEIETNGTIPVDPNFLTGFESFNISVKLQSSNQANPGANSLRINPEALVSFPSYGSIYKFVVTDPIEDIKEISKILEICNYPVYLMPHGNTREEIIKNSESVAKLAIDNKWNYSPREHVIIWGGKRGC